MINWLRNRWSKVCSNTIGTDLFWSIAVDHLSIYRALNPSIQRFCQGTTLDAGAGGLAWKQVLANQADHYIPIDYAATHPKLGMQCDLQGKIPLRDASIETIFCCSVLEHTTDPWKVLPEFQRILSADGHLILSVPFLYHLHGSPHDFYRFTTYGISHLAQQSGLEILEIRTSGGPMHVLCHAISMLLCALIWNRHAPWLVTIPVRLLEFTARTIDSLLPSGLFSQNINAILRIKK